MRRLMYKLIPLFSYLPDDTIMLKHASAKKDESGWWSYWMDVSYYKYCRRNKWLNDQ